MLFTKQFSIHIEAAIYLTVSKSPLFEYNINKPIKLTLHLLFIAKPGSSLDVITTKVKCVKYVTVLTKKF